MGTFKQRNEIASGRCGVAIHWCHIALIGSTFCLLQILPHGGFDEWNERKCFWPKVRGAALDVEYFMIHNGDKWNCEKARQLNGMTLDVARYFLRPRAPRVQPTPIKFTLGDYAPSPIKQTSTSPCWVNVKELSFPPLPSPSPLSRSSRMIIWLSIFELDLFGSRFAFKGQALENNKLKSGITGFTSRFRPTHTSQRLLIALPCILSTFLSKLARRFTAEARRKKKELN